MATSSTRPQFSSDRGASSGARHVCTTVGAERDSAQVVPRHRRGGKDRKSHSAERTRRILTAYGARLTAQGPHQRSFGQARWFRIRGRARLPELQPRPSAQLRGRSSRTPRCQTPSRTPSEDRAVRLLPFETAGSRWEPLSCHGQISFASPTTKKHAHSVAFSQAL